ncbi:hypothetical protein PVAND_009438 [Polypedilum vanderplanki]|uniref:Odorant receptor n=1 Tax=Polypedilum vanderplanki TaxID=319348 RepID=A0A9J6CE35_POLVA|nr:hypothetical protein PVAND_009438 [Polypedilum vanderplanki]
MENKIPEKLNFDDFFNPVHKIFKIFCIDFESEKLKNLTKWDKIKKFLKLCYITTSLISLVIFLILQIILIIIQPKISLDDIIEFVGRSVSTPLAFTIIFLYTKRKNQIIKILNQFRKIFPKYKMSEDKKKLQNYYNSTVNIFGKFYIRFNSFLIVIYVLFLIKGILQNDDTVALRIWLPKSINRENFCYKIFEFIWTISITVNCLIPLCSNNLMIVTFTTILVINFEILKNDLKVALNNSKIQLKDLKLIVDRHNELFEISRNVREHFSILLFIIFVQGSFTFSFYCAMIFISTDEKQISYIINIIFGIPTMYLQYHYGQKLIDSSENLENGILESNWYNIKNKKIKKSLIILILRLRKSEYLTGEKWVTIQRETFTKVRNLKFI